MPVGFQPPPCQWRDLMSKYAEQAPTEIAQIYRSLESLESVFPELGHMFARQPFPERRWNVNAFRASHCLKHKRQIRRTGRVAIGLAEGHLRLQPV
jgi:hypothetical protein